MAERRLIILGKIAEAYVQDGEPHAFDRALDAAFDAGRRRGNADAAHLAENFIDEHAYGFEWYSRKIATAIRALANSNEPGKQGE